MDCSEIKCRISAALDGEDAGLPEGAIRGHLKRCAPCRAWSSDVTDLHRTLRLQPAVVERDRTYAILAALPLRSPSPRAVREAPLRIATLVIALVQIATAIPLLLGHSDMMHGHDARHIGVFSAALAIAMLVVAWRPERARALLPMLAVLVAGLAWSCLDDLISGRPVPGSVIGHGADVAALGVVWLLAHTEAGADGASSRRPILR